MPRSVPLALAPFPAAPARAGERRSARSFRPAACGAGDDQQQQQPPSMAAVPASLRAIQARRKQAAAQRGVPRATATSAAGCAVAALVKAVEAVQGAAAGGACSAVQAGTSECTSVCRYALSAAAASEAGRHTGTAFSRPGPARHLSLSSPGFVSLTTTTGSYNC